MSSSVWQSFYLVRRYLTRIFRKRLACFSKEEGARTRPLNPQISPQGTKMKNKKNTSLAAFALRLTLVVALVSIGSVWLASSFANVFRTTHSTSASRVENG